MNIDDLTIGQGKELAALFGTTKNSKDSTGLNTMLNKKVIIRTYSAGVWFGTLSEKAGNEVILTDARRMYQWWATESISLSACALYGIKHGKSKIVAAVDSVWLEAIEITPCTTTAIASIEGAPNVAAE